MLYYTQQFRRNGSTMFPETEYQNISIQITSNRSIISHKDYAGLRSCGIPYISKRQMYAYQDI